MSIKKIAKEIVSAFFFVIVLIIGLKYTIFLSQNFLETLIQKH